MLSKIYGNLFIEGALGASEMVIPPGAITNNTVASFAGISASKLEHQHRVMYAQPNTTAVNETKVVHVCYGASGTLVDFRAGCINVCSGDATITVDIKKNGVSVLASPLTLNSADTNRVAKQSTISSSSLSSGDVLEVTIIVSAGTGTLGDGVFAAATINEQAQ